MHFAFWLLRMRPPQLSPDGLRHALGDSRTLPRIARDAARAEAAPLRVLGLTFGHIMKFTLSDAETARRQKSEHLF